MPSEKQKDKVNLEAQFWKEKFIESEKGKVASEVIIGDLRVTSLSKDVEKVVEVSKKLLKDASVKEYLGGGFAKSRMTRGYIG